MFSSLKRVLMLTLSTVVSGRINMYHKKYRIEIIFLSKILRLNKPCSGLRLSWHFTSRRNQLLAAVHSGRRKECTVMSSLFNIIQSFRGREIGKQGITLFIIKICIGFQNPNVGTIWKMFMTWQSLFYFLCTALILINKSCWSQNADLRINIIPLWYSVVVKPWRDNSNRGIKHISLNLGIKDWFANLKVPTLDIEKNLHSLKKSWCKVHKLKLLFYSMFTK